MMFFNRLQKTADGTSVISNAIDSFQSTIQQLEHGISLNQSRDADIDAQIVQLNAEKQTINDSTTKAQTFKDNLQQLLGSN